MRGLSWAPDRLNQAIRAEESVHLPLFRAEFVSNYVWTSPVELVLVK
jgi:hypothetical protein